MIKAAFFDLDGTLTSENAWRGIMAYFEERKLRRNTHRIFMFAHMSLYMLRKAGLLDESTFRSQWAAHLAWYVRGMSEAQAQPAWDWVADEFMQRPGPDGKGLWRQEILAVLQEHLRAGDLVMLVSSGPQPLIQSFARRLGVTHALGTVFELRQGRYTGRSLQPVCIDQYKASLARHRLEESGLQVDLAASHAYADASTDLHLLEMVGNPTAVYPDEGLRQQAIQRGWRILPG